MRTKIAPSHHAIATLLTDDIISEMTQYLMEDYGYTLEKALDVVYRSKTVELLQIEKGELYVQSPPTSMTCCCRNSTSIPCRTTMR